MGQAVEELRKFTQKIQEGNTWSQTSGEWKELVTEFGYALSKGLVKEHGYAIALTKVIMAPVKFQFHYHNELETIQLLDGEFEIEIEGENKILSTGETITIRPQQKHRAYSQTGCVLLCTTIPASQQFPDVE